MAEATVGSAAVTTALFGAVTAGLDALGAGVEEFGGAACAADLALGLGVALGVPALESGLSGWLGDHGVCFETGRPARGHAVACLLVLNT